MRRFLRATAVTALFGLIGSTMFLAGPVSAALPSTGPFCDSSPNHHATKHAHATSHPVIASAEPGERWLYCYPDDAFAEY